MKKSALKNLKTPHVAPQVTPHVALEESSKLVSSRHQDEAHETKVGFLKWKVAGFLLKQQEEGKS